MTDDSNFTLLWEIDNARAVVARGMVESGVLSGGGFDWTAAIEQRSLLTNFSLRCVVDHNRPWSCEANVEVFVLHTYGEFNVRSKDGFTFNDNSFQLLNEGNFAWANFTDLMYNVNDKIALEFRIHIISSESEERILDTAKFAEPTRMTNIVLAIGDKKLHVSKEFLAVHSPVFETLFFGDFAEKGKEVVELKDVVYEEFIDLLYLIYPGRVTIKDSTVCHILGLGDRFQMERVLALAETHLQTSKKFNTAEKLCLADQYRLVELRNYCLKKYSTVREIGALELTPEYANFSADMKAAICDRMMKLVKSMN